MDAQHNMGLRAKIVLFESEDEQEQRDNPRVIAAVTMLREDDPRFSWARPQTIKRELSCAIVHDILQGMQDLLPRMARVVVDSQRERVARRTPRGQRLARQCVWRFSVRRRLPAKSKTRKRQGRAPRVHLALLFDCSDKVGKTDERELVQRPAVAGADSLANPNDMV